ncbi:MAG: hypothetical protein WCJ21_05325 [Planctomycetota bacterium]
MALVSANLPLATAEPIVPTYVFGIADNNQIWQIDPVPGQQSASSTFSTGLTGLSNAAAFDRGRDQMFFLSNSNDLYMWNKPLGGSPSTFQEIATSANLGISSSLVFNASYYSNAFWFFKEATNELVKASLSYSGSAAGTVPTFTGTTSYTTTGPSPATANGFGDIAINGNTGILYAATSTGLFYTLDLSAPTTSYTEIKGVGSNISLQLAFNQDYSVLYGQNYTTGEWYSVDETTGNLTDLNYSTIVPGTSGGFRDLAGSSPIPAVPEIDPASFGSAIAMLIGCFGLREKRAMQRLARLTHG